VEVLAVRRVGPSYVKLYDILYTSYSFKLPELY